MKNLINICCSGSSGSTFFARLLNRHPYIACGDEIGLFSKPIVFKNFDLLRRRAAVIKKFGISSAPFFVERSILRSLDSYTLTKEEVWRNVINSNDLRDLVRYLHKTIERISGKHLWAEKTPDNVFQIYEFLETFPHSKVIHIVRDPRDVALSLRNRGLPVCNAVMTWLTSVASAQRIEKRTNLLEIRYEDLVLEQEKTLERVCEHIGVRFNFRYFLNDNHVSDKLRLFAGHNSWTNKPNQVFSTKAIGKYKKEKFEFTRYFGMRLTDEFSRYMKSERYSVGELMRKYGYEVAESDIGINSYKNRISAATLNRNNYRTLVPYYFLRKMLDEENCIPLVEY